MRNSLLKFALLISSSALMMSSCIDDTYDLSGGVDDKITVGSATSTFVFPVYTIDVDMEDIVERADLNRASTKAPQTYTLRAITDETVDLGSDWLPKDIVDMILKSEGSLALKATILGIPDGFPGIKFDAKFGEYPVFTNQVLGANSPAVETNNCDLKKIAESTKLIYSISSLAESFSIDLNNVGSFKIHVSIRKTGSLKL